MKLTKVFVGYYILSILTGLCSTLSINLSLLQKRWVEIEKRRRILTVLLLDTKKRKGKKREDNADSGRGQGELLLGGRVLEITLLWKRNGERISDFQKQRLINSAMNCDHFCRRNVLACERHWM